MKISVNERNQKLIERMVESGEYNSPDEVVDIALRLLEERQRKLEVLRKDIQKGFDSGEPLLGEQVMEELIGRATAGGKSWRWSFYEIKANDGC